MDWAVEQGIETATFHILTPYPGTALHQRMRAQNRMLHSRWDLYDTRHTVFQPARLSPEALEEGYWRAYEDFYRWGSILKGAWRKELWPGRLRHFAYAAGWKKFEFLWNFIIRTKQVASMLPVAESILEDFGKLRSTTDSRSAGAPRDPGMMRDHGERFRHSPEAAPGVPVSEPRHQTGLACGNSLDASH